MEYEIKEKEEEHKDKKLKIILHDVYENKKINFEFSDDVKIIDIKRNFAADCNIDLVNVKLRILFGGNELMDENFLYQYNIKDEYIIQILKINMC